MGVLTPPGLGKEMFRANKSSARVRKNIDYQLSQFPFLVSPSAASVRSAPAFASVSLTLAPSLHG